MCMDIFRVSVQIWPCEIMSVCVRVRIQECTVAITDQAHVRRANRLKFKTCISFLIDRTF